MGYIYCITNLINSKKYIGKTELTIEERWRLHCRDSKKENREKRPLYDAFRKYGIENFKVELLEFIEDNSILSEREIFWIKELLTFGRNGYNATSGGDGHTTFDHKEILELYLMGYSVAQVSNKVKCDVSTIRKVLKAHGIKPRSRSKMIDLFDLAGNYILTFDSTNDAKEWLFNNGFTVNKSAHKAVGDVCEGRRKNPLYGYIWKYKKIPEF